MNHRWWVVCAKELKETLRDRRTLTMMVVVPVLLYPVLLIVMEQLLLFGMRNLEADAAPVAVVGEAPRGAREPPRRATTSLSHCSCRSGDPIEAIQRRATSRRSPFSGPRSVRRGLA